jgi:sugar lactone lactonase YvrE
MQGCRSRAVIALALLLAAFSLPVDASTPATPEFARTWARTDKPVADSLVARTWMWGPEANTDPLLEDYVEAPGGERTVQYFDKSRMEDNSYRASEPWDVTNGLLVVELMTGVLQLGDNSFEWHDPADVNVGGDPDDPGGPTYASMSTLMNDDALPEGALIIQGTDRSGTWYPAIPRFAVYGVTAAHRVTVPGIDHTVASPFWDFMNAEGPIWSDEQLVTAALFSDPFYATGYPVTEAYWATILVGGTSTDVLLQCFERRCLTYTPGNPEGWQVEAGNVGQHYYHWRYVQIPNEEPPVEGNYVIGAEWDTGTTSDDPLDGPSGLHIDAAGNLLVVDTHNGRVLKYDLDGNYIAWGPDGGGLTGFNEPTDVTTDSQGNVYVADSGNTRFVKYDTAGTFIAAYGSTGSFDGQFYSLTAIASDADDHIYITDVNMPRVQVFDQNGQFLRKWGEGGAGEGQFASPMGITVHGDYVYVSDMNNHRIQVFDHEGNFLLTWGEKGHSGGSFDQPVGIATDAAGNVYVADNSNFRAQVFTATGEFIEVIESDRIFGTLGVAPAASGSVFIASTGNNTVLRFDPAP